MNLTREEVDLDEVREALDAGRSLNEVAAGFEIPPSTLRGWLNREEKPNGNGHAAPGSANGHAPDTVADGEHSRQTPQRARAGASKLRAERRSAQRKVEKAINGEAADLKAVDLFLASRWASLSRMERLRRLFG